jgi:hypothetical protein
MLGLLSWRWLLGMCMLLVMCITIVWCLWYFFDPDSPRQKENEIESDDDPTGSWSAKHARQMSWAAENARNRRSYWQKLTDFLWGDRSTVDSYWPVYYTWKRVQELDGWSEWRRICSMSVVNHDHQNLRQDNQKLRQDNQKLRQDNQKLRQDNQKLRDAAVIRNTRLR